MEKSIVNDLSGHLARQPIEERSWERGILTVMTASVKAKAIQDSKVRPKVVDMVFLVKDISEQLGLFNLFADNQGLHTRHT